MCRIVADAVEEGQFIRSRRTGGDAAAGPAPRTLTPEEEQARAAEQAEARRQAALAAAEREARIAAQRTAAPADEA